MLSGICCLFAVISFSQNATPSYQSNLSLSFSAFRTGVNTAYVSIDERRAKHIIENPESAQSEALNGIIQYLYDNGFENIQWGDQNNTPKDVPSLCEMVIVKPEWRFDGDAFTEISMTYLSCKNDVYTFTSDKPVNVFSHTDVESVFYKRMQYMYSYKKSKFDMDYSLMLESEMTAWKEQKIKSELVANGAQLYEGIYESINQEEGGKKLRLAVKKSNNQYEIIYLDGAPNYLDWNEGEVKSRLTATATQSTFKCTWKEHNKSLNDALYMTFDHGSMILSMGKDIKQSFIKTFPATTDQLKAVGMSSYSGTGFAISNDGLFVTNYHVVKDAKGIQIKGIGGDSNRIYNAEIVLEDRNNDLAVLKITDANFQINGNIPYSVSSRNGEVGAEVFVLGYPMPSSMGTEIKLTNGLISSKSGYHGDVSSYQISAPVQPGNSGGPVFDEEGNIVGIINSRHADANSASYAVKSIYLDNLMDLLAKETDIPVVSKVAGKPLTEQVRQYKDFICIVEVM